MDATSLTIGSLFQAAIRWILLVLDWYIWQPLMTIPSVLATYCSWDRDSRCSASITDLSPGAGPSPSVDMDLEWAYSGTYQSKGLQSQEKSPLKSEGSSRPSTGLSDTRIVGLEDQQRAFPRLGASKGLQYRQKPLTLDELMLSELLRIHLDEKTADKLSYSLIHSFSGSQRKFLSVLYRRTRGQQALDCIYSPTFFELMHGFDDAATFQDTIKDNLQNLEDYIKEEGVENVLSWRPRLKIMES